MSNIVLTAKKRDTASSVRALRKDRSIPGVLYGHGVENKILAVEAADFNKIYKEAGDSMVVDLTIEKETPIPVLIRDISRDVETHEVEHVDFYQVNMNEKLTTDIPVTFTGEAPAVKTLGGVLITQIESIPVRCLPKDLVREFIVDLGSLTDFTKRISLSDISGIPESMEILRDMDSTVVLVNAPRVVAKEEAEVEAEGEAGLAEAGEAAAGEAENAETKQEEKAEGGDKEAAKKE